MLGDIPRRREGLGIRIATRDLENCLEDVVSIYEAVLKAVLTRRLAGQGKSPDEIHDLLKRNVGNRLQNISNSNQTFRELLSIEIFDSLDPKEIETLTRTFGKRHPITHNLGVVDRKYLERLRTAEREGREVLVTADEVTSATAMVMKIVADLHRRLFTAPVQEAV
jgi:hypothetical protein